MALKRNILISTLTPLGGNYGGALQAYALQRVLRDMGHEVTTSDSMVPVYTFRTRLGEIKRLIALKVFKKTPAHVNVSTTPGLAVYTREFVRSNMATIDLCSGKRRPDKSLISAYDTYVVGSDQVWRARYADVPMQLFDYVDTDRVIRFSYAASFGRDDMSEYSLQLINKTAFLAKKFDGLSVREDSGIGLVEKNWGMSAECHVDPTLLISCDEYKKLISSGKLDVKNSSGNFFVYVLDKSDVTELISSQIASVLGLMPFEVLPQKFLSKKDLERYPEKFALPPVEQWLKSFDDADFVLTDSFHGVVFSIIFNKPFIVVGNEDRGLARFKSLLKMFELEDRLVSCSSSVTTELLLRKIDYQKIETIKRGQQERSYEYLRSHLG